MEFGMNWLDNEIKGISHIHGKICLVKNESLKSHKSYNKKCLFEVPNKKKKKAMERYPL